jgi:diguanylate cyclase (GGDEF)-like protein
MVVLSLLPSPSGAAQDPIQNTLGSVYILNDATAAVPQTSVGGGALPQVGVAGQDGGGLQLTVTPAGSPTGTPTQPQTPAQQQPQSQPQAQPGGSSSPASGGDSGSAGSDGQGSGSKASRGARRSSGPGSGTAASPSGPARARGAGADQRGGRPTTDKPSFVTRVVQDIPPVYRALLLGVGAIAVMFGLLSLYQGRRSRRAQEDALSDPLTGLANRQAFEQELDREWKRATRYEHDLGLLLIDLDGFKEINDTHGHIAGDRVLREAAAAIAGRVRETDFPARLGGDEFVVICPETGEGGMRTVADGLERTLREDQIAASVGFADRKLSDEGPSDLIARADSEMYRRKRESGGGRGRAPEPVAA